ncbi:15472_t:CDS:10 [Acaulospora morrowiae]|uniref:15472_t:CDS:1 n=1 Tax=Acaulospora morrowiae TaxID=94023 RepID=A0A9N9C040_9GLOM|nr:15472_t:CDS:10 [Acaulospora morrowiae]
MNERGIPDGLSNISTYLEFVNREKDVSQLMMNMERTPGKGKTTLARREYEKLNIYSEVIGQRFFDNDNESLFGKVLLYESLKYRLKLREVLKSLSRVITNRSDRYFLFVVLTGTHASDLFETVKSSNAKTEDISLPLLKWLMKLRDEINKLSEQTKYKIKLLGVVGRFLESMIFQMSVIGSSVANNKDTPIVFKFYQSGLRYYLEKCQYESKYCDELLIKTKKLIKKNLFEKKRKIEDLERREILDSLDNAISPNQNETPTVSLITFRLWVIYQKSISDNINNITNSCSCRLSRSTDKQINEKNWDDFTNEPFILIQDKQLIVSRSKVIEGYSATMLEKGFVEKEHNKCKNVGEHIFLFVTDSKKRNDETYKENDGR